MPDRDVRLTAVTSALTGAGPVRRLGTTGLRVGAVGQGTTRMGDRAARSADRIASRVRTLRLGVELGMNLIDTAEIYGGGHAEEVVAEAIRGIRSEVVLASKFLPEHSGRDDVIRAADASLRRLETDYLDLYQAHWPNPLVPMDETLAGLARLVEQGKVRYVGLSNVTVPEIAAVRALSSTLPIVAVQSEYSLVARDPEAELLPYCGAAGITVLAYSVLSGVPAVLAAGQRRPLDEIAARYGVTTSQVMLAWVLRQPGVVALVKAADERHTRENAAAMELVLDGSHLDAIDAAFRPQRSAVPAGALQIGERYVVTPYRTAAEAFRNPLDLVPAPRLVAANIERGHVLRPLRVVAAAGGGYDLVDNQVLYWGWVIANGRDAPIPVTIVGSANS